MGLVYSESRKRRRRGGVEEGLGLPVTEARRGGVGEREGGESCC